LANSLDILWEIRLRVRDAAASVSSPKRGLFYEQASITTTNNSQSRTAAQTRAVFQPNPHRVPFRNLEPFRDSIETLRVKGASYAVITDLLREHGVKDQPSTRRRIRAPRPGQTEAPKAAKTHESCPAGNTRCYTSSADIAAPTDQSAEFISIVLPETARPAHCKSQNDRRHDDLTVTTRNCPIHAERDGVKRCPSAASQCTTPKKNWPWAAATAI